MIFIISKLIMAEFWYNTLAPVFGSENIRLIYTGEIRRVLTFIKLIHFRH